jgi:hypothetical protein
VQKRIFATNELCRRGFVYCLLAVLLSSGVFAAVQISEGVRAGAANCGSAELCVPSITPTTGIMTTTTAGMTTTTAPRVRAARPTTNKPAPVAPLISVPPSALTVRAVAPTSCAAVIAGVTWPAGWRVLCAGPRPGLLGLTDPAGVTTLFVRAGETMARLRIVALHEAGHAWDLARLDGARIEQWCAARGCDAVHFFSGGPSSLEPGGAEDWAASWDACHGGEYHRSYLGLGAPDRSQCALQDRLVGYRR